MQEIRNNRRPRLGEGLAGGEIAVVSQNDAALFAINRERALIHRTGHVIKRAIDARYDEKKAEDQQSGNFEESFHRRIKRRALLTANTMTENRSKG